MSDRYFDLADGTGIEHVNQVRKRDCAQINNHSVPTSLCKNPGLFRNYCEQLLTCEITKQEIINDPVLSAYTEKVVKFEKREFNKGFLPSQPAVRMKMEKCFVPE